MLLVYLLATLGMVSAATEPPQRADRTALAWQEVLRRTPVRTEAKPAAIVAAPSEAAALAPNERAVRVLGADGRPAVGIMVRIGFEGQPKGEKASTDKNGLAKAEGNEATVAGVKTVRLEEPLTVVRIDWLVPATAVFVDTRTGAEVARRATVPSHVVRRAQTRVAVGEAPDGFVVIKPKCYIRTTFRTKHAILHVPARPHARLVIRVREADGSFALGAVVAEASMGAPPPEFEDGPEPDEEKEPEEVDEEDFDDWGTYLDIEASAPAGANGRIVVKGVPFLQGEKIGLVVRKGERHAYVATVLPADNVAPHEVEVTLPRTQNHEVWGNWGLRGHGWSHCRSGRRRGRGSAVVRVHLRDGSPAVHARVILAQGRFNWGADTDATGVARFERLPRGTFTAYVFEPGYVSPRVEVAIDGRVRIDLYETTGWTARIVVLDELGRPVPFARVSISKTTGPRYACTDEAGTQDVLLYTDHHGVIELPGMADGPIEVTAGFGTRSGQARVKPGDGMGIVRLSD